MSTVAEAIHHLRCNLTQLEKEVVIVLELGAQVDTQLDELEALLQDTLAELLK